MKKTNEEKILTWKKLLLFAVAAGVFTAVMAIVPALHNTSFITITATFEVWIFFGIYIILHSSSPKDSALKCFVFFLVSQPLVYLLQVPFSYMGWELFQYYPVWFVWTVLCLPMGYIGYSMKKNKWWGYLILLPMILLTAYSYYDYFRLFLFSYPRYLLISLFCIFALLFYPLWIFQNKKIRVTGVVISALLIAAITVISFLNPIVYSTDLLFSDGEVPFDDTYTVSLEGSRFGKVEIQEFSGDVYRVHADFTRAGETKMVLESPAGEKEVFRLHVESNRYEKTRE